jgi:BASS family bile acid:Na+ symporter
MPDWGTLVVIALQAGIVCVVVATGLRSRWSDATYLLKRPGMLARSIIARNILVPLIALAIASVYAREPAVRAAMLVLSVTGVPPTLPESEFRAGSREQTALGILISQTLLAIVFVPAGLLAFNAILGTQVVVTSSEVVAVVGELTLVPFFVALVVSYVSHPFATRISLPIHRLGQMLLIAGTLAIAIAFSRTWIQLAGNGTLLAVALMVLASLAVGHALGGQRRHDRIALAIASASSHPGIAIAIVTGNARTAVVGQIVAAVLLYIVIGGLVIRGYTFLLRDVPSDIQWRAGGDRRSVRRNTPERRRVWDTTRAQH